MLLLDASIVTAIARFDPIGVLSVQVIAKQLYL